MTSKDFKRVSLRDDSKCWNVIDILWDIKESCVTIWEGRDILIFLIKVSHQKVKRTKKSFYLNILSPSLCFFLLFNVWRNFVQGTCPGLDFFLLLLLYWKKQRFCSSLLDTKNLHRYKVPDCTFTSPAPDGLSFSCFQIKYSGTIKQNRLHSAICKHGPTTADQVLQRNTAIEWEMQTSFTRQVWSKKNKTWAGPFSQKPLPAERLIIHVLS